ncbi:MAG: hypothetical protein AAF108_07270 [Planctomycetota bacterium]
MNLLTDAGVEGWVNDFDLADWGEFNDPFQETFVVNAGASALNVATTNFLVPGIFQIVTEPEPGAFSGATLDVATAVYYDSGFSTASDLSSFQVFLEVDALDSGGVSLGKQSVSTSIDSLTPDTWESFAGQIPLPEGTASVIFTPFSLEAAGSFDFVTIYLDDLFCGISDTPIVPEPVVTPLGTALEADSGQLVPDPGFEDWVDPTLPLFWQTFEGAGFDIVSQETLITNGGLSAARLAATGPGTGSGVFLFDFAVAEPGQGALLSVDVYVDSAASSVPDLGSVDFYLQADAYDENFEFLGASFDILPLDSFPVDAWDTVTGRFTYPSGTVVLDLLVYAVNNGESFAGFVVDNASFETGPLCTPELAEPFNGSPDFFDFLEFLTRFDAGDLATDLDNPGEALDSGDVEAFIGLTVSGCP